MKRHHLIILKGQVMPCFLEMRHLEEETGEKGFSDRWVVVGVRHWAGGQFYALLQSDTQKLFSDVISRFHTPEVYIVIIAPVRVLFLELIGVVEVKQGQVVPVLV